VKSTRAPESVELNSLDAETESLLDDSRVMDEPQEPISMEEPQEPVSPAGSIYPKQQELQSVDPDEELVGALGKHTELAPVEPCEKTHGFCCPSVTPRDTVTACCPRLGGFMCIACMLRGRIFCLTGPDWTITWFCLWPTVLTPTILFLVWGVRGKVWHYSPALGIVSCAVVIWFWFTLFVASCFNPGILRKHNEPDPEKGAKSGVSPLRYCNRCKLYQPANTQHCADCGVCVYGYDHHCGFMGQCIGKINVWAFQCFLGGVCVVVIFMVVALLVSSA